MRCFWQLLHNISHIFDMRLTLLIISSSCLFSKNMKNTNLFPFRKNVTRFSMYIFKGTVIEIIIFEIFFLKSATFEYIVFDLIKLSKYIIFLIIKMQILPRIGYKPAFFIYVYYLRNDYTPDTLHRFCIHLKSNKLP